MSVTQEVRTKNRWDIEGRNVNLSGLVGVDCLEGLLSRSDTVSVTVGDRWTPKTTAYKLYTKHDSFLSQKFVNKAKENLSV